MAYFVVCYDITEDKQRDRVVKLLHDSGGMRVQYSVFEIRLAKNKLRQLMNGLKKLTHRQDSIIVYELCKVCKDKTIKQGQTNSLKTELVVIA